jgi:hypothetical protein
MPRYMIIRHADATTEAGFMPDTPEVFEAMGAYMEQMAKAGILRGGDGLRPTREAKRVTIPRSGKPRVVDGPFTETKELIAGYTLIECDSEAEALEWMKRWPAVDAFDGEVTLELRRLYENEAFGDALPPELREREDRLRAELEKKK